MNEPNPHTVTLTPSHYFLSPGDCWKRNGAKWKKADPGSKVLLAEVYWWLRENVGFEMNEVWDVDRYFYPNEERPELPSGHGGMWIAAGRKSFYAIKHLEGEYSHNTSAGGSIYFPEVRHAREFRARFQKFHDGWDLIDRAMRRRFPYDSKRAAKLVRELPPIHSVASVVAMNQTVADNAFTGRVYHPDGPEQMRIMHLFCDENTEMDRVLFMLANTAPDPWWVTAKS